MFVEFMVLVMKYNVFCNNIICEYEVVFLIYEIIFKLKYKLFNV